MASSGLVAALCGAKAELSPAMDSSKGNDHRFKDSRLMARPTHAVVLGAGMAGMLASSTLARHFDAVTVIDRDVFPAEPALRKGIPQAKHAHLLWSGGARIMESLLPGITGQLLSAGARRATVHQDVVSLSAFGWQHRFQA